MVEAEEAAGGHIWRERPSGSEGSTLRLTGEKLQAPSSAIMLLETDIYLYLTPPLAP